MIFSPGKGLFRIETILSKVVLERIDVFFERSLYTLT